MYNKIKNSDKVLWCLTIISSLYSLLLIKSACRNSNIYFYKSQSIAIAIGFFIMIIVSMIDYNRILEKWKFISFLCIFLIFYTLFFGITIKGISGVNAKAWISIPGGFTFQPSELAKIGFILTFSKHLSYLKNKFSENNPKELLLLILHAVVPLVLTHFQGDDGAAIIFLFIAIIISFLSGIKLRYFIIAIGSFILSMPFMWKYLLAPYQKKRIINQLNPESDPLGMGYQQIQGKLSIGSGGFIGKGLFNGPRVADSMVPIQESDFIFSVVGEELGFIGCILILSLLTFLIWRIAYISKNTKNTEGLYICFGFISLITAQIIFNIGMCLSFLPVVGVTLPFFSAGGSSIICLFFSLGILQSIYIKK